MVREMTNSCLLTAKIALDTAFDTYCLARSHTITQESISAEIEELSFYDVVFSSNPMVDRSLVEAGVPPHRICKTSFGWTPKKYQLERSIETLHEFTAIFVGLICVRKGIMQLLAAWSRARLPGKLILVGDVDTNIEVAITNYRLDRSISFIGFTEDLGVLYRSANVFVFPSIEEGGPQVVYEAAGCGLPIIATEAGGGRLLRDGINGIEVPVLDVDALASALVDLYEHPEKRAALGHQAGLDAQNFTYEKVAMERNRAFRNLAGIP